MPEIKNTFLKGRMNKSLDDRLLPEGEYRDALNIQVTKSEGSDVGVIQNIKGNERVSDSLNLHASAKVLGSCFDDQNNIIYYFVHHGADRTVSVKAQSTNVIFLDSVNAVNPGDIVYYIDPATNLEAPISGALDTLFVSTVDYQNNSITVVHDPSGPSGNIIPSITIPVNTVLLFTNEDLKRSKIYKYDKNSDTTSLIVNTNQLNFQPDNYIQANIVENYLFFTDGYNEPRKIDVENIKGSYGFFDLTVAKIAPQFPPIIEVLSTSEDDIENTGNYIEEKFVRFAYRYKFSDNTYSVYSPFSNIVFALNNDTLTEAQIQDAYSKGELDFLTNKARTISITPKSPSGATGGWATALDIVSIDILMKASDSPAVFLLDTLKIDGAVQPFIYNSEKPKTTLPESQLTRVFDNVPQTAVAQEIVGNRVVYGNFTQGFDIDTTEKLPFNLKTVEKELDGSYLDYLGVKSNRTYEVGIVFSDSFGRTSPVMFGQKKSININGAVQDNYNKQLAIEFTDNIQAIKDAGFDYYSVVVKQSEQEYYNIYTPGLGSVDGRSYFALFGDNINKIPIDTSTYNSETNINTTKTKVYLGVENKTISSDVTTVSSGIKVDAYKYTYEYDGGFDARVFGFTNVVGYSTGDSTQTINGFTYTRGNNKITPAPDGANATFNINIADSEYGETPSGTANDSYIYTGFTKTENTLVEVYVDGVQKTNSIHYLYNKTAKTVQFTTGNIPETGQNIVVFFKYDNISISSGFNEYAYSLTNIYGAANVTRETSVTPIMVTHVNYTDSEIVVPSTPFAAKNLEELKITGISTRNNFEAFKTGEAIDNASITDLTGIYKKDNNYLLVEVDGLYGVPFVNTLVSPTEIKYADLAVLETKGFESVIDIYYETATQGLVSTLSNGDEIRINYFNCINLKTPARTGDLNIAWQESRIKGGFNEPSMGYGVQAYITNDDYGLINRKSSLIYSGILKTLDPVYGSIQKLYADTDDLLIFQEEKVSQALIDKDVIYTAEGQGLTTTGQRVISQINAYSTNYGIGKDPQSFTVYAGRKYFVDRPKGAVLRLSRDGITEISNYGMRSYFRDVLNNPSVSLISGSWDIYNKEYVLSIHSDSSITLGFDESNNGWVSRYSYIAEDGGSLDGNFYTFKRGELYLHNTNSGYNTFYNQAAAPSTVELIFNENPSANKNFNTINYEGTNTWDITTIETDTQDVALPITNNVDAAIDTDAIINLSVFKKYDQKYFANIINDSSAKAEEVVFGESMSGVKGHFMKVTLNNSKTGYQELFSISTGYNLNSY